MDQEAQENRISDLHIDIGYILSSIIGFKLDIKERWDQERVTAEVYYQVHPRLVHAELRINNVYQYLTDLLHELDPEFGYDNLSTL